MYEIRSSCPYSVIGNEDVGYGYATSSQLMLPGLTSAGAEATGPFCRANTPIGASRSTPISAGRKMFFIVKAKSTSSSPPIRLVFRRCTKYSGARDSVFPSLQRRGLEIGHFFGGCE